MLRATFTFIQNGGEIYREKTVVVEGEHMGRQHVWEPNTLKIFGSHLGSIFAGRSNSELDLLADCLVVVSSSKYSYFSFTPFCDGRNPYTCMREREKERERKRHIKIQSNGG